MRMWEKSGMPQASGQSNCVVSRALSEKGRWSRIRLEREIVGSASDDVKLGFWAWPPGSESSENRENAPEPGLEDHQHLQVTQRRKAAKETESKQPERQEESPQRWAREGKGLTMLDARRSNRVGSGNQSQPAVDWRENYRRGEEAENEPHPSRNLAVWKGLEVEESKAAQGWQGQGRNPW